MTLPPGFRIRTRMTARDTGEEHRVSSPLELLFDLTFVVAIAQIAGQLARHIETGVDATAIISFLMVFFAIWWAWMNFTWFASSYDTDDVAYRLLTLLQMGGVLVLAAGVPTAFDHQNFFGITLGYFIMRVGLVAQWTRAAIENPDGRRTAIRYAAGVTVVQLGWLARQFVPVTPGNVALTVYLPFVILAALELTVPFWAERTGGTAWHPHHIAERYGLFTIILLGEGVAALAGAVQLILNTGAPTPALVTVGIAALVLIFALWWLYYLQPAGAGLQRHRDRSYLWGYGHYAVFAALAALGGGLEVVVHFAGGDSKLSPVAASYAVAVPTATYLLFLWAVNVIVVRRPVVRARVIVPATVVTLLIPLGAHVVGMPAVFALVVLVVVVAVAITVVEKDLASRRVQRYGTTSDS
jgi:low temperature requirement protein LtrA